MYSRKFTLRHTFDKFSNLTDEDSPSEVHFGIPWNINVEKLNGSLNLFVGCHKAESKNKPWSVDVTLGFHTGAGNKFLGGSTEAQYNGKLYHGLIECCKLDVAMEKYVENDKLTVEVEVIIKEMKGIVPKRKISFDEPEADISDVVLAVGDRKFHVSKVILGRFSDFFKPLFFSGYKESKQSEIKLEAVDPDTFQMLLEIIHGRLECINDDTVEDLLHLARQYQVEVATARCVDYLVHQGVDLNVKYRLACEYKLLNLQDHLMTKIKVLDDADRVLKQNIQHFDDAFVARIMRKVYLKK